MKEKDINLIRRFLTWCLKSGFYSFTVTDKVYDLDSPKDLEKIIQAILKDEDSFEYRLKEAKGWETIHRHELDWGGAPYASLLSSDEWEILYIKGEKVTSDHSLERDLLKLAEEYSFTHSTLSRFEAEEVDRSLAGDFPKYFKDLKGNYNV